VRSRVVIILQIAFWTRCAAALCVKSGQGFRCDCSPAFYSTRSHVPRVKLSCRGAHHRNCLCCSNFSFFTYQTYVLSSVVVSPTYGTSSFLQHKDALELLATVTQQTETDTEQQHRRASTELPRLTIQPVGLTFPTLYDLNTARDSRHHTFHTKTMANDARKPAAIVAVSVKNPSMPNLVKLANSPPLGVKAPYLLAWKRAAVEPS
jgi:hypothetical protein